MGNHREIGMDNKPPQLHGDQEPSKNVRKHFQQLFMFLMIAAVFLFASAGTLVWVWAWAYVAIYILFNAVMLNILPKDLLAERGKSHTGVKKWDRSLKGTSNTQNRCATACCRASGKYISIEAYTQFYRLKRYELCILSIPTLHS